VPARAAPPRKKSSSLICAEKNKSFLQKGKKTLNNHCVLWQFAIKWMVDKFRNYIFRKGVFWNEKRNIQQEE
jgi:hypothetical protein